MIVIPIICVILVSLIILIGLAVLICFIGGLTESVRYVIVAILAAFLLSHFVLDCTFSFLAETYHLPSFSWHWLGIER